MVKLVALFLLCIAFSSHRVDGKCSSEGQRDIIALIELQPESRFAGIHALKFITALKDLIAPKPECTRLGVMLVSNEVSKVIHLNCDYKGCFSKSQMEFYRVSNSFHRTKGAFNKQVLAEGLKEAANEFIANGRQGAKKVLLLVLANAPTPGSPKTEDEVKDLLDMQVSIMAIGVGKWEVSKLAKIAEPRYSKIVFESMAQLASKGGSKVEQLLRQRPSVGFSSVVSEDPLSRRLLNEDKLDVCQNIVDIAFVMDSSGSVKRYYNQEKFFVKRIATRFNIIEAGTHGGVVLFSSHGYIKTHVRFKEFMTTDSFNEAVDNLPFYGYLTRIDRALELAHRELYTEAGGARPNVKKLLFLITDGRQNPDEAGGRKLDPAAEAEKLHLSNVQIYAVGVGTKVNVTELIAITKDAKKVYTAKDFEELTSTEFVTKVSKQLCKGADIEENVTTISFGNITKPNNCSKGKCGCGCCGNNPVYVNIFQGGNSRNSVNQGQTVVQSGSGNQAGALDGSSPLTGGKVKAMSNEEIVSYIKKLIPYFDSMNGGLKELIQRTIINKRKK